MKRSLYFIIIYRNDKKIKLKFISFQQYYIFTAVQTNRRKLYTNNSINYIFTVIKNNNCQALFASHRKPNGILWFGSDVMTLD